VFVHLVLFKIKKKNVKIYRADCRLWHREAKRAKGFLYYHTFARTNAPDQYASCYFWKTERTHRAFMKKNHDRLVSLSHCPVEVVDYVNFKTID